MNGKTMDELIKITSRMIAGDVKDAEIMAWSEETDMSAIDRVTNLTADFEYEMLRR